MRARMRSPEKKTMIVCILVLCLLHCGASTLTGLGDILPDVPVPDPKDFVPEIPNPVNLLFQNKCIEAIGCFYTGPPFFHPINRPISLTPTSELKTKFVLFTPTDPKEGQVIEPNIRSIQNSSFDDKLPMKVLIHGYRSDLDVDDIRFQIIEALLNHSDYNILLVDWTEHNGPPYPQAVANARAVGAQLANLLNFLINNTNVRAGDIHIIGHSLGGQMSGWAGERITGLGRITGLDPAGPMFQDAPNEVRLDATDALFVDVIHSDGGENVIDGLGIGEPIGHMDFYPNGGLRQPGCSFTASSDSIGAAVINGLFQNKCIENLDCFYTGPPFFHPLYRPISVAPSDNLGTQFLLYTRMNPEDPQVLVPTEESLSTSTLDPYLETKILIHGYTVQLEPHDVRFKIKNELLQNSPMNVIIVNWTADNTFPYYQAVANARAVAAQVAKLINYHVETMQLDPRSVHVIGHSLGGQITGWVGERVPGLGRITGLDPAGPWFQNAPPEVRLDPSDAHFIDVIHTNGGDNFVEGFGLYDPMGHLDFYPNGGSSQPGCFFEALNRTNGVRNRTTDLIANSCGHSRANFYFMDSINRCQFVGVQCDNYNEFKEGKCTPDNSAVALMGYHATKPSSQSNSSRFYLLTTEDSPFCGETDEII